MAQPIPYTRRYDFVSFQTLNPKLPLPAQQHENEYNAILQSLNGTITNLGLIQRDDGKLANGSVGWDQLSDEVTVGIAQPFPWVEVTQYSSGDMVYAPAPNESKIYRSLDAHVSSMDFDADLAAGHWVLQIDFANATNAADEAAAAAEAALDEFSDMYLGPLPSDPTTDNDGDPLQVGAFYWNTTVNEMRVWTGTIWQWGGQSATTGVSRWNNRIGDVTLTYDDITDATATDPLATDAELAAAVATLNTKNTAQDNTIATKANTSYVDAQDDNLQSQIDTLGTSNAGKADKSYVDAQNAAQDSVIDTKANSADVAAVNAAQDAAIALKVPQTGPTGAGLIPAGNTANRPLSPVAGHLRYNTETGKFEGHNGTVWGAIGGGAAISETPPTNPQPGDFWWSSALGILFVYYYDGDSSQWVSASPVADTSLFYTKAQTDVLLRGPAMQAGGSGFIAVSPNTATGLGGGYAEVVDTHNAFNPATGYFTPPIAGYYQINFTCQYHGASDANKLLSAMLWKNGAMWVDFGSNFLFQYTSFGGSLLRYLTPADAIAPVVQHGAAAVSNMYVQNFSVHLVRPA